MPWKFNFEDYELFCKLLNKKASRYATLKEFARFVKRSEIDILR